MFLYYSHLNHSLAEKFIQSSDQYSDLKIIVPENEVHHARELKSKFKKINEIIDVPNEDGISGHKFNQALEKIQSISESEIVMPMYYKTYEFQFITSGNMPFLRPFYSKYRQLWRLGFRAFISFNLHGTTTYQIDHLLDAFENKHKDQRCFIVGNGPSLNDIDMTKLSNEITFGCNRGFLGLEKWGFQFTYWAFGDRLQVEMYHHEYENYVGNKTIKMFPFEYIPHLNIENACPINFLYGYKNFPQFSGGVDVQYLGHSMVYMLLQIAISMGCNPIILVGVDNRYEFKKEKKSFFNLSRYFAKDKKSLFWTSSDSSKATHFDSRYTEGDKVFVPPRPEKANQAYEYAANWTRSRNINVLNATPNTGLDVFKKIDFNSLFL